MEYTTNYHLPQWVESDRIMMEDFNQMCSDMEAGLVSNAQAAAAAQAAADNAQTVAETAQETADSAQAAADAIHDAYTPGNKPYVVGSYTGTGEEITITLGFRPSFLCISGMEDTAASNSTSEWDRFFGMTAGKAIFRRLSLTSTGFVVYPKDLTHRYYPDFTDAGRTYDYIAFR